MKKISLLFALCTLLFAYNANAYQVLSSKELGKGDAKNQNVVVKCTTDTGKVSNQTCTLRRYAKCTDATNCGGWQQWRDLQNPGREYTDWRTGASDCCKAKGLR